MGHRLTGLLLLAWLWLAVVPAVGQRQVVSGVVRSALSGEPLAQVSVQGLSATADERLEAVVTNDEGLFTLKSDRQLQAIVVSHLGYHTRRVDVGAVGAVLDIRLQPATVQLREVTVWTGDARELVALAVSKIPHNYSAHDELSRCFYRETAMKRHNYVYVAEGVLDMYKAGYSHSLRRDRVAIRKGRRLMSPRKKDTLTVKVTGGPVQALQLDVVKHHDMLFSPDELQRYELRLLPAQTIDDRLHYVVGVAPRSVAECPWALYHGQLFIDAQTLAFSRIELQLDMSDRDKATQMMLVKKPMGLRFKPRELSLSLHYAYDGSVSRLSYVRTTFRFNCDWKRRLIATSFTAVCEMVTTGRESLSESKPITGRESFDRRDAFYDKVDYFRDPDFWSDYNIIEPTEHLDRAIDKIVRRYRQ